MLRRGLLALAALALTACAHKAINDPASPIVQATARVMIAALAEEQSPQHGFQWWALRQRISRFVHWHPTESIGVDPPPDAIITHAGWIEGTDEAVDVAAQGTSDRVSTLAFTHDDEFTALSLLEALRSQGAEVSFQADYETNSEYLVSMPGREAAMLTAATNCPPFEPRPARGCTQTLTLAFEMP